MSDFEHIILIAFLFSFLVIFSCSRDIQERIPLDWIRNALMINCVFSSVVVFMASDNAPSFRSALLYCFAAMGSTEVGYWFGQWMSNLKPNTSDSMSLKKDPFGVIVALIAVVAMLII
jgi:hypothetical protein